MTASSSTESTVNREVFGPAQIGDRSPLFPFGDSLSIDAVAPGQGPSGSLDYAVSLTNATARRVGSPGQAPWRSHGKRGLAHPLIRKTRMPHQSPGAIISSAPKLSKVDGKEPCQVRPLLGR